MIDFSSWPASAKLSVLLSPFVFALLGLALNVYIASSRHFQVMCWSFRRSSGLEDEIKLWGVRSLRSRMLIISSMTLGVIWPSFGVRRGWLSVEDSNEFPVYLRRTMKISSYSMLLGFLGMVLLTAFLKFTNS